MYRLKAQGWIKHFDFLLIDVLSLNIAYVLAFIGRFGLVNPYKNNIYIDILLVFCLADILVTVCYNSLTGVLRRDFYVEMTQTVKHSLLVVLIVAFYLFSAKKSADYSRIFVYLIAVFYVVVALITRFIWKKVLLSRRAAKRLPLMYVITNNDRAEDVVATLSLSQKSQHHISGVCVFDRNRVGDTIEGVPVTSSCEDVVSYLCRQWVDEVFISLPADENVDKLVEKIIQMGIVVHLEFQYGAEKELNKQTIEKVAGRNVLTIGINFASANQAFLKRALDIVAGVFGCIATLLLTIIIGPLIYKQSPGPIFFSQTRIGKNGKKFKMYKFRSMYLDAEERKEELKEQNIVKDGMMFKVEYDPRIIGCKKLPDGTVKKGIGNFIRDYSLDEFPQFLNVLLGSMSLCGTRPPTEDEWNKYELHHRARLAIKPGITGLWQVSGRSNITDFEEVVKLDTKYIRDWSMGLDLKIIFETVKSVLKKDGSM